MNGASEEKIVIETIALERINQEHDVVDGGSNNRNRQANPVQIYKNNKSTAEGMMDISLLTANANQLKFILYYNQESKTFYFALALIILSLILQIAVGILLIFRVSHFILCYYYYFLKSITL